MSQTVFRTILATLFLISVSGCGDDSTSTDTDTSMDAGDDDAGSTGTVCTGIVLQCGSVDFGTESTCTVQAGCRWNTDFSTAFCDGLPAECGTFTEEDSCMAQLPCQWE